MATINYTTLQLPEILWSYSEVIQKTTHFEVRRYRHKAGVIFRIPNGAEPGQTHHAFMEHEINLSNTLKTGTLTMKVQVTFVPCYMGVFSGFHRLKGSYDTDWHDEYGYGEEYFVPDYKSPENERNIVPLPPNLKTNLFEYLNEILFQHIDDAAVISKYAVDLGCQRDTIKDHLVPAPVLTSDTLKGNSKFHQTIDFFNSITSENGGNLLPGSKPQDILSNDND